MSLIGPGTILKCVKATTCDCGAHKVTEGALYTCVLVDAVPFHALFCGHAGCTGILVVVRGKQHGFCECCFRPLNDGDTSLVEKEADEPVVAGVDLEPGTPVVVRDGVAVPA